MAGRVIALDVGDVRIGVAVSDPTGAIAQPLEVYRRVGYGPDSRYVKALCDRYETNRVVLGLPLNMDGTLGGQAQKAQDFGRVLQEKMGLNVSYQDERMTTVTAEQVLIGGNVRREDRRLYVDKLAAAVILEQWLASQSRQKEDEPWKKTTI
ncbi:MAG: Holliday junction resolvase RuvX [Clostridia bacterium]|nr:Holliday junction resolvase RuvX [Clostridia bacterium]MDD6041353.1 Holliday junction resolvase RuvX [Clostridia bacterium]